MNLKKIYVIILVIIVLFIIINKIQLITKSNVTASKIEMEYYNKAIETNDVKYCDKINPRVRNIDSVINTGQEKFFVRNNCYLVLAQSMKNDSICDKMVDIHESGFFYAQINYCKELADKKNS